MNKRYIDFVPTKKATGTGRTGSGVAGASGQVARSTSVRSTKVAKTTLAKPVSPKAVKVAPKVMREVPRATVGAARKRTLARSPRKANAPRLGVIEELSLEDATVAMVTKPVKSTSGRTLSVAKPKVAKKEAYNIPKTPFINQNKVVKRPLSKNVYQKRVVAPTEKPTGPVTIISKPEKAKHASLIVTIIITIILGAAAGTVAFLLLPK